MSMDLREQKFGIEIELTGLTRKRAAEVIGKYLGQEPHYDGGYYEEYSVRDEQGRKWKVMYDSSIVAVKKGGGSAGDEYKVEFVSPICEYADIPTIQELVRQLRHAGAIAGENAGIHVHVNAAPYTARTLRNITNIMYCKEDLIYKALQVDVEREHRYCKKVEESFLQELNQKKPKSIEEVSNIWYRGRDGRNRHYHESRYHCLNLHSVFQKGTIEFRLFNSTTHAGKIKTYIQLCLAISAQALNQSSASRIKTTSTNEKYTFRTWLLRLGMIGDEFKTARKFLLENLEGGIAWKNPEQAERQKERLKAKKEKEDFKKLYEGNATGKIPDKHFNRLLVEYDTEQSALEQEAAELKEGITAQAEDGMRAQRFISIVRRYTSFDELTAPMLNEFIEKVVVHEADKSTGDRRQKVDIYFNFIGCFVPPKPEVILTAEEEAKAQKALAARNREREQNKLRMRRVREAQRAAKEAEKAALSQTV